VSITLPWNTDKKISFKEKIEFILDMNTEISVSLQSFPIT